MKSNNIGIEEVRRVCQELVKRDGDCFEVAKRISTVPIELIRKIKSKEYMKSISDSYFDSNKWNPKSGVHEPERIMLDNTTNTDTDTTPTTTEITHTKRIAKELVVKASELISQGVANTDIQKQLKISKGIISRIKMKKSYREISDEYFTMDESGRFIVSKHGRFPLRASLATIDEQTEKMVRLISEDIANGFGSTEITTRRGVPIHLIQNIKTKHSYKPISDEYFDIDARGNVVSIVRDSTVQETASTETKTTSNGIFDEIDDIVSKSLIEKTIKELPESLQAKIIPIVNDYVDNLTIKEFKELIK